MALNGQKNPQGLLFFNQELLQEVHKYVVKEYITQVIKPRWKMNRETRQQVSRKMSQEAAIIHNTLIDQVCELSPGHPLAAPLSEVQYSHLASHRPGSRLSRRPGLKNIEVLKRVSKVVTAGSCCGFPAWQPLRIGSLCMFSQQPSDGSTWCFSMFPGSFALGGSCAVG